jgi:hypothetical protein
MIFIDLVIVLPYTSRETKMVNAWFQKKRASTKKRNTSTASSIKMLSHKTVHHQPFHQQ